MIHFKEITKENLVPVMKLKVKEEQKGQVAMNAVSIAQAHYHEEAWMRALYDGDTPVGFVMLSIEPEIKEYWVWRYMIDQHHQNKGYGRAMMNLVIDYMKTLPGITEIKLSYVPKESGGPDGFYRKLGFVDTGEVEEGEKVMSLKI